MKSEELRIGNYVSFYGEFSRIESIGAYGVSFNPGFAKYTLPNFKPIPLTEDVLLRLKFKCVNQSEGNYLNLVINSNGDYLASNPDGFFFVLNNEDDLEDEYLPELSIKLNIQHLHQLQNLYYALTGQELNIKGL